MSSESKHPSSGETTEAAASADALCVWLRRALESRLRALRDTSARRTELEVLLAPAEPATIEPPPVPAAVTELGDRLRLRDVEREILSVLFATALEPALGRALGLLADPLGRGVPTWDALARLLGLPATSRPNAEDGLLRWALVSMGPAGIALDPFVETRLCGKHGRDPALLPHLAAIPYREPLPGWPLQSVADQVQTAIRAGARGVELWLRGPEGSGRRTFFAAVARTLGLVGVQVEDAAPARTLVRQCWLDDLAPLWNGASGAADLPPPILQGRLSRPGAPVSGVAQITVSIPRLDHHARREAWQRLVHSFAGWNSEEQRKLVDAWSARPGQLVALQLTGAVSPDAAAASLRSAAVQQLEGQCDILETPFEWDDIVLSPALVASLRELAFEARALPALWEEPNIARIFPQGRSIAALFSGPPGTGKTMAAQVLAREIGLPLFRVDLSRIVSKYVGETSQNLARLLEAARDIDAVVFFDEADALFSRRTAVEDAHDRYANTETDYLLQALDSWPGVSLLATNKRNNVDPAFLRRMRLILEFPRPDGGERLRIWRRLTAQIAPESAGPLDRLLGNVAENLEFTGAQIKGALLTARLSALRAGTALSDTHLVRGIERELEKDGRGLSPRDRSRLLDLA